MNRQEESLHIKRAFQQNTNNNVNQINIVVRIRDEAIKILTPVVKKVPRNLSKNVLAAYKAKGISTEWNLKSTDVYDFRFAASEADLTLSEKKAADLLVHCTKAIEADNLSDDIQQLILDTYSSLDDDATSKGKSFSKSQSEKARRPRGILPEGNKTTSELISELALSKEHEEETAKKLWPHFISRLDELGLDPTESDAAVEYDFKYSRKKKTFRSFENDVSKARKPKKSH